jgi:hypothetical protein
MNAFEVRGLLQELIDENPFAIRAVLKILAVEFTDTVPTLAVTNEERPRLLINLGFVGEHCRTAEHVKAVLCHEFLHVLLRHTSVQGKLTPARHLALDAMINAIIHRQLGDQYSGLMATHYRDAPGLMSLLRPMMQQELHRYWDSGRGKGGVPRWWQAWFGLYQGTVLADDLEQLAQDLVTQGGDTPAPDIGRLLGNHGDDEPLAEALERALDRARREMNGGGIWRNAGPGANPYELLVNSKQAALADWKARTLAVLRKHIEPAPGAPRTPVAVGARLPVLSPSDRRAFLRATWSPFLPEAEWAATATRPQGRAQVYLDVSGSMNAEMPLIVALLGHLSSWIRRPFWAFSTEVVPAVIERGVLRAGTSGGTSLSCVLEHVARTRPACAVIVTDGYVEAIAKRRVAALGHTRLHAVVTRDGNPAPLKAAGIPYSQLGRLPR